MHYVPLLTQKELALILKVSLTTVKKMTTDGTIPVTYLGLKTPRYQIDMVMEALEENSIAIKANK